MTRLSLLLLLLGAAPLFAQTDAATAGATTQPATSGAQERVENWSLVRPMPVVTLQIRRVVGYLMLAPAVTLFLLYLFRPRPYVLAWIAAWLAASVMLLVLSFDSGTVRSGDSPARLVTGRPAMAAWALAAMTFGASLRFGALWFRNPATLGRATVPVAAALVAWVALSAAFLRPGAVIVSGFLLMTLLQIRAAMEYVKAARRYRFIGALHAGAGVAGIVIVNNVAAGVAIANRGLGDASTTVSYFNGLSAALLVLGMHLLIFEDLIDELRTAAAELARGRDEMKAMAVTDPLTRCYNRRFLDEIAHHELQQHRRYDLPLSLLYLDIDHFKAINDTRGHQTGDTVLETLGAILRERTRKADYVFRWGGDEFLVLLSADEAAAREKAQAIRQAFLESPIVKDLPDGVDLSIGCVAVPPETETFDPLIHQADREMYRRKRTLSGKVNTSL
ncbi:MAG: GGDEF domain-containing protein [Acidobacteriota bacterium]|nr:GGDEF domain-containing protein [Acidobacteriota bacterium]